MGLNRQFNTIVYHSDTGVIKEILPNKYIKSRKALNNLLGLPESKEIKFFYVPGYFPLLKENWIVKIGSKNRVPRLISRDGRDGELLLAQKEAEYILQHYKEINFFFEGGLGDYIDQVDVMIACGKNHPGKKLRVSMDGTRVEALSLIEGFKNTVIFSSHGPGKSNTPVIKFSKINSLCANYLPDGKIGAYSLIAGLDKTAERNKIIVPADDLKNARAIIQKKIGQDYKTIIALHTMSGNCNTKGILPDRLPKLLTSILNNKDLWLLHFGGHGEEAAHHKRIISLQGKLNWKEVFAVMSLCDGCICIDSAILHIAQHLNLPTVSFWGPTDCNNILGADPGVESVTITLKCRNCNRYECNHKNCMENLDQKEVNRKIKKLLRK
ncbi:hypothetical protein ES708_03725 [subsurface metagenome]